MNVHSACDYRKAPGFGQAAPSCRRPRVARGAPVARLDAMPGPHPPSSYSRRLAIHRLDNMNNVVTCAAFFASPRYRVFV